MKILMITKNWLGDILFEFPTIEAIKKQYPDSKIACLAPKRCHEILENHPDIDEVIEFDERTTHKSLLARFKFIMKLRKEKWDQVYLFHRSRTRASMMFLGGVKERIGFGGGRKLFLTKSVEEPDPSFHQVDHFLKLTQGLGYAEPDYTDYRFFFKPEDLDDANRLIDKYELENYVNFHLGANWEPKRWPPEHFARLADLIDEIIGATIVVTGADRDMPLYDAMMKEVKRAKVICLVGKTGLGELGALFQKSSFMVSGDSGPMHIASGVGARVVALFGPTEPKQTGPRGVGEKLVIRYVPEGYQSPWYGEEFPRDGWMSHIKPEEVLAEIKKKGWLSPSPKQERPVTTSKKKTFAFPYFGKGKMRPVQNILIVTLSNIGDVILTTPVMTAVKKKFPDAKLTVVVGPKAKALLSGSTSVDRVVVYDKKVNLIEKLKFLRELRQERYDWVIDLRNTAIPYLVKTRKRSPMIRLCKELSFRKRHLEILKSMTDDVTDFSAFDFYNPLDEKSAVEKVTAEGVRAKRGWIAVAPVAASELKTWKLDGFKKVIERLLEESEEDIVLVGDKREGEIMEPLVAVNPKRVHNLGGKTTLRELAAIVARASLLLTNDSAVMHLGYEMDRPVVAIFGPTHHQKYGRVGPQFKIVREEIECSPCEQPRCKFERQHCFEDLSAEKVVAACKELLGERLAIH